MNKVVCISKTPLNHYPGNCHHLTIGKTYEYYNIHINANQGGTTIIIKNDIDHRTIYDYSMFVTLDELRDKKLIELGI